MPHEFLKLEILGRFRVWVTVRVKVKRRVRIRVIVRFSPKGRNRLFLTHSNYFFGFC